MRAISDTVLQQYCRILLVAAVAAFAAEKTFFFFLFFFLGAKIFSALVFRFSCVLIARLTTPAALAALL